MRKSNYSDEITKFATVDQARERYKLSRDTVVKLAKEADAVRKIGRSIRIDIPTMDSAVDSYR